MTDILSPGSCPVGGAFFEECTDAGNTESVYVDVSEIELQPSILAGRDVRAELETSAVLEAKHLQDRCVDLATEVFVLKNKVDEQAKELKWAKREAEAREKDFKEIRKLCEEERHSARSLMRRVKTVEDANSKLSTENEDLKLDRGRLLGVLRKRSEAGLTDEMRSHRERLRKRPMSEREVNKCDLASARMALKATRQENDRLLKSGRGQANKIHALEETVERLAQQLAEKQQEAESSQADADAARQEAEEIKLSERRAQSDMEHEALLRLEAVEHAGEVERAEREARQAQLKAEQDAESLRAKLAEISEKLYERHSAHGRHQGSVARYQTMIDTQASALQAARQQLLGEKVRRQEVERQARLKHIAKIDGKTRASEAAAAAASGEGGAGGGNPGRQQQQQKQKQKQLSRRLTCAATPARRKGR